MSWVLVSVEARTPGVVYTFPLGLEEEGVTTPLSLTINQTVEAHYHN